MDRNSSSTGSELDAASSDDDGAGPGKMNEQMNLRPEDLPKHDSWKFTPPPKSKGKEICCPTRGKNISVSIDGTLGELWSKVR